MKQVPHTSQLISFRYTVDEAFGFRHNYKISGAEVDKFRQEMNYYETHKMGHLFKKKEITDIKEAKTFITQTLNKLTFKEIDYFISELDCVCNCSEFVNILCSEITDMAFCQWNFAPLYAIFINSLIDRYTFGEEIRKKIVEICLKDNRVFSAGMSLFTGFLAYLGIISIPQIYALLLKKKKEHTNDSIDTIYNISIICGEFVDLYHLNGKEFYDNLGDYSKSFPSRTKFLIMDLLETREDNWDTHKLLPKEYCEQSFFKNEENPFSKCDDIQKILFNFRNEKMIFRSWTNEILSELLIVLINDTDEDFNSNFKIIDEIKNRELLNKKDFIQVMKCTYNKILESNDIFNKERFGSIIMKLIILDLYEFNEFGGNIPYDHLIFYGILKEASESKKENLVSKSQWIIEGKFLPPFYGYIDICKVIDKSGFIGYFELYDDMYSIYYNFNKTNKSEDEIKDMINEQYDESFFKSSQVIEFLTEFLVLKKPLYYKYLSNYILNSITHAINYIGKMGKYYKWTQKDTANKIKEIAKLLNYDLSKWIENSKNRNVIHKKIFRYLKD